MLIVLSYRIQVRYGSRWGPRHPSDPNEIPDTAPVEILLSPGEYMTHISGKFGYVIDGLQVSTNLKSYAWIGRSGTPTATVGTEILYLKGATYSFRLYGIFATQLTTVYGSCDV